MGHLPIEHHNFVANDVRFVSLVHMLNEHSRQALWRTFRKPVVDFGMSRGNLRNNPGDYQGRCGR